MLRKITLLLLPLFLLGLVFVQPAFAQSPTPTPSPSPSPAAGTTGNDEMSQLVSIYCNRRSGSQMNLETWYGGKCKKQGVKLEETIGFGDIVILDLLTKLTGETPTTDVPWNDLIQRIITGEVPDKDPARTVANIKKMNNVGADEGILGNLGSMIGYMYQTPPASFGDYLASVNENLHKANPVQPAYAQDQGFGFESLLAVLPVWRAFRNFVYLLFILVFIAYGFFIMFRINVGKQAVATIQTVLPRLVVTLLLITFSYAIAGLVIDLSYVVTGVVWSALAQVKVIGYYSIINDNAAKIASGQTIGIGGPMVLMLAHVVSFSLTGRILSAFMPDFIATVIGLPLNFIVGLVILIAAAITLFRVFWMLLKSYVSILVHTMFAPLLILPNVLPGSSAFSDWLKTLAAEISVFVATTFAFIFTFYFIGPIRFGNIGGQGGLLAIGDLDTSHSILFPPPLGGGSFGETSGRFALLGLGIFFLIPKLGEIVRGFFKVQEFKYGSAIVEPLQLGYRGQRAWGASGYGLGAAQGLADRVTGGRASRWQGKAQEFSESMDNRISNAREAMSAPGSYKTNKDAAGVRTKGQSAI